MKENKKRKAATDNSFNLFICGGTASLLRYAMGNIMKKVAISTIFYVSNYGTVLQSYATQQIIRQLGCDSVIIRYIPKRILLRKLLFKHGSIKTNHLLYRIASVMARMPGNLIITYIFNNFRSKYLNFTEYKYEGIDQIRKNPPEADIYLTGSDQVWNSQYNQGIDYIYYLGFVPDGKTKIAYSASIGDHDFELDEKEEIKSLLEQYRNISVREESAKEAITKLGINHVEHVLDPTFLLRPKNWIRLCPKRKMKARYLLLYILGRDKQLVDAGIRIAKIRNLKIVKIGLDFIYSSKVAKHDFFCTPNEFINYFYYADYIITNSFHGLAFSINFNKQFSVIMPRSYQTRLSSLLHKFDLNDRLITDNCDIEKQIQLIDYNLVNRKLERERRKSIQFLKNALNENHT